MLLTSTVLFEMEDFEMHFFFLFCGSVQRGDANRLLPTSKKAFNRHPLKDPGKDIISVFL